MRGIVVFLAGVGLMVYGSNIDVGDFRIGGAMMMGLGLTSMFIGWIVSMDRG